MLKKVIGFILLTFSAFSSAEYISTTGTISRIDLTTYWGGYACLQIDGDWYHFKYDDSGSDFIKSTLLAAKMSQQRVNIGSNTNNAAQVCGSITSHPVMVLKSL